MLSPGARLLRLPWRREDGLGGVHRPAGLDLIVRAAARDLAEASAMLAAAVDAAPRAEPLVEDWADVLAGALRGDPALRIGRWAEAAGVTRETVSARFRGAYGVAPARFRVEFKAREAWLRATGSRVGLAAIAADLGFADQPHMTRAVRAATGDTPASWRRRLAA
jgi:AraC-like DNA-binding protein